MLRSEFELLAAPLLERAEATLIKCLKDCRKLISFIANQVVFIHI